LETHQSVPLSKTALSCCGLLLLLPLRFFSIRTVYDIQTNPPIFIGRRLSLDVLLFLSLFYASVPFLRSEYLGSCILLGPLRSAIIYTQTVGHSLLKKQYSITLSELDWFD